MINRHYRSLWLSFCRSESHYLLRNEKDALDCSEPHVTSKFDAINTQILFTSSCKGKSNKTERSLHGKHSRHKHHSLTQLIHLTPPCFVTPNGPRFTALHCKCRSEWFFWLLRRNQYKTLVRPISWRLIGSIVLFFVRRPTGMPPLALLPLKTSTRMGDNRLMFDLQGE